MDLADQLARNLVREAEAYGFTLAVWGGGSVLLSEYDSVSFLLIVGFVAGALLGYGTLAALVFRSPFELVERDAGRFEVAIATVHVVGSFLNVVLSYLFVRFAQLIGLSPVVGAILVGVHVTVTYNLGLLTEQTVGNLLE